MGKRKKRKVLTRGGKLVEPSAAPTAKPVDDGFSILKGIFFGSESVKKKPKK